MLPVQQACDLPTILGRPLNHDVAMLKVWMAYAESTEGGVLGYKRRRQEEIALQVLDMKQWQLLLVIVTASPLAAKWQNWLAELLEIG